jgi:hypothetical protein
MIYRKNKTSAIIFPLGGIGAGSIGLAGNGSLIDWEIFNAPSKGSYNGLSHFAVRAEEDGKVTDFRVLNGDLAPHYTGNYYYEPGHFGFGYGPAMETLCNLPHFRDHTFEGTYPTCRLNFDKEKFRLTVTRVGTVNVLRCKTYFGVIMNEYAFGLEVTMTSRLHPQP